MSHKVQKINLKQTIKQNKEGSKVRIIENKSKQKKKWEKIHRSGNSNIIKYYLLRVGYKLCNNLESMLTKEYIMV